MEFYFAKLHLKHSNSGIHAAGEVMKRIFTDFAMGIIVGFLAAAVIFCIIAGYAYSRNKDREIIEYVERQIEIETLREDYSSRDAVEFLDDIPGVRGAADGAAAGFDGKLDEILQRFRNRIAD